MKKFLSLVLAVIMTMSLVTISASAAEYKDFTDKDEIQYEEAVAVLNRLGIITGYSEGDFRPEGELTRGAAAKIIVSLLIGPEAANNVSPTTAPYKDVPLDHTFAGVIAYCKTAGIISGYSDGSFQPGGTLTGYAFSKMLLGALGFKSDIEHFTGSGWNMNVNARAAEAGLFDRLNFKGNDPVNREEAAQLALNTLKATMVEYSGGFTVNAGDASVVGGQARNYKTSNNRDYALNISGKQVEDGWWTVEFGEEHFIDLRLEHDKYNPTNNAMGDPSAEWSYKKVTIGTYPLEPDFSYDEQKSHVEDTDAAKKRALGLSGYVADKNTNVWLNGFASDIELNGVEDIADLTDNGTRVRVYVSETKSDYITDVVVEKTQLMEVKRIGSDYVSLQMYDNGKSDDKGNGGFAGFNSFAINKNVENVQAEDDYYSFLSGLKSGDIVAVVPVSIDGGDSKYEVFRAYTPETVSGTLTGVQTYGKTNGEAKTTDVTVGGTTYKVALWNKDLTGVTDKEIKVTRKDVTLYMDELGNAMLAKDVGATNDWMVIGNFRQTLENGRMMWVVNGWDISGAELSLNVGPNFDKDELGLRPGDLVKYTSEVNSNVTDWDVTEEGVYNVYAGKDEATGNPYEIKASNVYVKLNGYDSANQKPSTSENGTEYLDKSVKFIYVRFDADHEVESIEVKTGAQNVKNTELRSTGGSSTAVDYKADGKNLTDVKNYDIAQAAVKVNDKDASKTAVKAVVIKSESSSASASNMLYIRDYIAGAQKSDSNGKIVYGYYADMLTSNGLEENVQIYSERRLSRGDFASYTARDHDEFSPFYDLRLQNDQLNRTAATVSAELDEIVNAARSLIKVKNYEKVQGGALTKMPEINDPNHKDTLGIGNAADVLNLRNAEWLDLSNNKEVEINSVEDLELFLNRGRKVELSLIFNDNPSNDGFRNVYLIVINSVNGTGTGGGNGNTDSTGTGMGTGVSNNTTVKRTAKINDRGQVLVTVEVTRPSWVPDDVKTVTYTLDGTVDGVRADTVPHANVNLTETWMLSGTGLPTADKDSEVTTTVSEVKWAKVNASVSVTGANASDKVTASVPNDVVSTTGATSLTISAPAGKYSSAKVTVTQPGADGVVVEIAKNIAATKSSESEKDTFTYSIPVKTTSAVGVQSTGAVTISVEMESSTKTPNKQLDLIGVATAGPVEKGTSGQAYVDSIKAWGAGTYEYPTGAKQSDMTDGNPLYRGGKDVADSDCLIFVYEKSGVAEDYTFTIKKGSETVYTEKLPAADAANTNNSLFHVQITTNNSSYFANSGTGAMSTMPLYAGEYTYSVAGAKCGEVLSGKFTVKADADVEALEANAAAPTEPAGNDTADAKIKSLSDGAYVAGEWMKAGGDNGGISDLHGNANQNRIFKFTTTKTGERVVLTIYAEDDGEVVYTEGKVSPVAFDTAGGHFFYVQVSGTDLGNAGDGTLKTRALDEGTYRYTIYSLTEETMLVQGTFAIGT